MKRYIIIVLLIFNIYCKAQNEFQFDYVNFENQFLSYNPTKNLNISKKDFVTGTMIIKETKIFLKNNPKNFNCADYLNALSAFLTLKESEENIKIAFKKFRDAEGSCQYILHLEKSIKKNLKYNIIREDYNKELERCKSKPNLKEVFDISEYCKTNNLDLTLIKKINRIDFDDQKYRTESSSELQLKQKQLDNQNQIQIDSLFNIYKSYIGKTLVGEKFESVIWSVVQHSNIEMMGKYLPIIQKAVEEKELDIVPFKMLIDRFYGLKYGYQVFGSQSGFGFEIANEKKIKEIEIKYGIE
jgi:hypothetical protein